MAGNYKVQFKCNRWCNADIYSSKCKKYYDTIEEAEAYIMKNINRQYSPTPYRIVKHLGGRKYEEIKVIEPER